MSYRRFPNLGGIVKGDLVSKLRKGLPLEDFVDRDCNCNLIKKVFVTCIYKGGCCGCFVVYKVTCKYCDNFCIVDTQNTLQNNGKTLPRIFPKVDSP